MAERLAPPAVAARQILHWSAERPLTDDDLDALSAANRDLRLERTADGALVIMSPAKG